MSKNVQLNILAVALSGALANIRINGGEAQPLPEGHDSLLNLKPGDSISIQIAEARRDQAPTETRSIDAGEVTPRAESTVESRAASSPDEAARIADADLAASTAGDATETATTRRAKG